MFILRRYENYDYEQIRHLHPHAHQQIWNNRGDKLADEGALGDESALSIDSIYFEDDGEFLIGELNGHIIAMGAFKKSENDMAEISMLWIHLHFQRQDYGKIIVNELEKKASELGYKGLYFQMQELETTGIQKLYRKCGFNERVCTDTGGLDYLVLEKRFG
jgi:GNAT superfamily N-acetyltransferase